MRQRDARTDRNFSANSAAVHRQSHDRATEIAVNRILIDGGLLSLVAGLFILGSMAWNPRLWLKDYPQVIQDAVPPRSRAEKRLATFWGLPYLILLLAAPAYSCLRLHRADPTLGFSGLFLHTLGVSTVFNLVDLLLLDWLIVCLITPAFVVIPGTAGSPGYKDYGHHLRGFWAGMLSSVVISALLAGAIAYFA